MKYNHLHDIVYLLHLGNIFLLHLQLILHNQKTSDGCVIDITMANAMTGEGTSYADLAPGLSLTSEEYGVAFRKESDVTAKFNAFMDKLIADGTLQALADKYSLTLAG